MLKAKQVVGFFENGQADYELVTLWKKRTGRDPISDLKKNRMLNILAIVIFAMLLLCIFSIIVITGVSIYRMPDPVLVPVMFGLVLAFMLVAPTKGFMSRNFNGHEFVDRLDELACELSIDPTDMLSSWDFGKMKAQAEAHIQLMADELKRAHRASLDDPLSDDLEEEKISLRQIHCICYELGLVGGDLKAFVRGGAK